MMELDVRQRLERARDTLNVLQSALALSEENRPLRDQRFAREWAIVVTEQQKLIAFFMVYVISPLERELANA